LPEIVTKRQQVILPHQEEEAFRKATEFVLLHSPQQGNLKEEAPLAGTVHGTHWGSVSSGGWCVCVIIGQPQTSHLGF